PFFKMSAGVDGKVDCLLGDLRYGPFLGRLWYGQVEARSRNVESAKFQHLPPPLKNGTSRLNERNPKRNQTTTPKVRTASTISHAGACAAERRHDNRSVGAAEIEGGVE